MATRKTVRPANDKKPIDRKRPRDVNQLAHHLGALSTGKIDQPKATDAEISRVMAELGRRGGKIGGKNRAASTTPERRREIALKAARSRWDTQASKD